MSNRNTAFTRTLNYFRTADVDEVAAALTAGSRILAGRMHPSDEQPKQKRHRRTKAELAEARRLNGQDATQTAGAAS